MRSDFRFWHFSDIPRVGDESAMWGKADIGALLAIPRLWRAGLWGLAQKVATETAEPVKKSVTRVLQKVI